jgi:hypothetical protein
VFKSIKSLLISAAVCGLTAGALYWWWQNLVYGTITECVTTNSSTSTDCAYGLQLAGAAGFTLASAAFLLVAFVRYLRPHSSRTA